MTVCFLGECGCLIVLVTGFCCGYILLLLLPDVIKLQSESVFLIISTLWKVLLFYVLISYVANLINIPTDVSDVARVCYPLLKCSYIV